MSRGEDDLRPMQQSFARGARGALQFGEAAVDCTPVLRCRGGSAIAGQGFDLLLALRRQMLKHLVELDPASQSGSECRAMDLAEAKNSPLPEIRDGLNPCLCSLQDPIEGAVCRSGHQNGFPCSDMGFRRGDERPCLAGSGRAPGERDRMGERLSNRTKLVLVQALRQPTKFR